jgi:histidine triad (HIT) family protein
LETVHFISSEEIVIRLQELTTGLYYQSESDYPLEVVLYKTALPDTFTEKELVALTGQSTETPLEVADATSFFRMVTKPINVTSTADKSPAQITSLQAFCEKHLQNMKVYRIGDRTLTALLLGKAGDGKLLGLKTTIIQT